MSTQQDIRTAGHMRAYFRLGQQVTSQEACPQYVHIFPAVSSLSPSPQPRAKMRGSKLLRVTLIHVPPTQGLFLPHTHLRPKPTEGLGRKVFYTVAMDFCTWVGGVSVTRSLQGDDAQGHECILCQCGLDMLARPPS